MRLSVHGKNAYLYRFPLLTNYDNFLHQFCRMVLRQAFFKEKEKLGHTTIDLGMAMKEGPDISVDGIKGFLVLFPLRFLEDEDLRPVFNESEYYASPQVFL